MLGTKIQVGARATRPDMRARISSVVLIALNVCIALYLWQLRRMDSTFQLANFGLTWNQLAVHHEWWRLVTALFVQVKWWHLVGNMVELWVFGNRLATLFGIRACLLVYFVGGAIAGIALVSYQRSGVSFGASLATVSLLGALLAHYSLRFRCLSLSAKWKLAALGAYGLVSIAFDVMHPRTGNIGHIVSLVVGSLLGAMLTTFQQRAAKATL